MFHGKVISGDRIGRTLGYPTANLDSPKKNVKLQSGVYAVHATMLRKVYPAALVIVDEPWKVEVHLIGYRGDDFYGRSMDIDPIQKVSEIQRYETMEELKKKILDDLKLVRRVLGL